MPAYLIKIQWHWLLILLLMSLSSFGQSFSRQDSLRGGYSRGRNDWDLLHYELSFRIDPLKKSIEGNNRIRYIDKGVTRMQIDLQAPLSIDSIRWIHDNQLWDLPFIQEGNAWFVSMERTKNDVNPLKEIIIYYHGKGHEAVRAPWDGGWVFTKDKEENLWMSVACQGTGASIWYPCKDSQQDEPDSGAVMNIIVPDTLTAVSNGRLTTVSSPAEHLKMYSWEVKNPINNYSLIPYIGKYDHFSEVFPGEKGPLDVDYWVLRYNRKKAETHFKQVPLMLASFEFWLGPYPFYEDGYKLVEAPYLGMEHQSAIAYGNGYKMGYMGRDDTRSGIGKRFDFIIIHESGHEWFGNSITTADIADIWVHEGFTTYTEVLYAESNWGKEDAAAYCRGMKNQIKNEAPCIGTYGVQDDPMARTIDMYYKGAFMIHTIRQVVNNDSLFRNTLRKLNSRFYHQTVTSRDVESFLCSELKISRTIFDQYLRTAMIPELNYRVVKTGIRYKWNQVVKRFDIPVEIIADGRSYRIHPRTDKWNKLRLGKHFSGNISINENYLVDLKKK